MDVDPFSSWGLRPVELADRAVLDPYFASLAEPLSDYTFSQLYTWRNSLRILWREIEGHLCVFANGTGDLTLLLPPVGDTRGDRALSSAMALMDDYNAAHGVADRTRVEYASDELLARFDRAKLQVEPMGFDYLYDVNRMIDLVGGDLASKRQARNRFCRLYPSHHVEPYDAVRHLDDCRALLRQWQAVQDENHSAEPEAAGAKGKRLKEMKAADLCLESADVLGLVGMVVYIEKQACGGARRLCGFTFGEPLGTNQSSITIEKTDLGTKGIAQFIFSEFCRTRWSDRPLVNVGDDWGLETLAWTKMSYRPVKLLQKYMLRRQVAVTVAVPDTRVSDIAPLPPMRGTTPLPVRVRVADKRDVAAALELEQACFSAEVRLKKRQLEYLRQRRSAIFLVAEQGEQIIGEGIALVRQHKSGLTGRIYSLAVRSDARRQRVGQQLLGAMCEALADRGVHRVYLEVEAANEVAQRLYTRAGFRPLGALPNYYGESRDGMQMMIDVRAGCPAVVR